MPTFETIPAILDTAHCGWCGLRLAPGEPAIVCVESGEVWCGPLCAENTLGIRIDLEPQGIA